MIYLKKNPIYLFIQSFILMFIFHHTLFAQFSGSPLRTEGRVIKDYYGNIIQLKGINLNDYIEYVYNPWGGSQGFQEVTSWLHNKKDYELIKKLGFNCVRLNFCPQHVDFADMKRLNEHIAWAKENNLYIIISYCAPPGSTFNSEDGYYDEWNFYNNIQNTNKFINDWIKIMNAYRDSNYSHVLYEFLNEPQINYQLFDKYPDFLSYYSRSVYKDILNRLFYELRDVLNDQNKIVIIDGFNSAISDYRGFNYLNEELNNYVKKNVIFSFHYYMDDFVKRGINNTNYSNYSGYVQTNAGFDTVVISFNTADIQNIINPDISISPFDQKGSYLIKYFDIVDYQNNNIVSLNLTNQTIKNDGDFKYVLYNNRKFEIVDKGKYNSSPNSTSYIINNAALAIKNTIKRDTDAGIEKFNYAALNYSNEDWNNQFNLIQNKNYFFRIILDGDSLGDLGGLNITLRKTIGINNIEFKRTIKNITYNEPNQIEKMLTSHSDRIAAVFNIMSEVSKNFNVPIFLGEFGIPVVQREPNTFKYYRDIIKNIEQTGFSWGYYNYREPHLNNIPSNTSLIRFGLFSGFNTSVSNIINGINSNPKTTSSNIGYGFPFYYNKLLIDSLTDYLGGYFDTTYTSVTTKETKIIKDFGIEQNYPNPFNPVTNIQFYIPEYDRLTLKMYDVNGQCVKVIYDGMKARGFYTEEVNCKELCSGVYFYQAIYKNNIISKKMVLIK